MNDELKAAAERLLRLSCSEFASAEKKQEYLDIIAVCRGYLDLTLAAHPEDDRDAD